MLDERLQSNTVNNSSSSSSSNNNNTNNSNPSSRMDGIGQTDVDGSAMTSDFISISPCFDAARCDIDRDDRPPPLPSFTAASLSSDSVDFVTDDGDARTPTAAASVVAATVDFRFVAPLVALVLFNLIVVLGNSLVIAAVFTHRKLRTVTNVFIVSLATSDLLLGLLVLPSSSAYELLGRWPFGAVWCQSWLAIDVWLCTASILNLCAISLDRYLAISRPFRYPTLMSPRRARFAVALVWTMALAICMPPLLGWRDSGDGGGGGGGGGSSSINGSTTASITSSLRTTTASFRTPPPTMTTTTTTLTAIHRSNWNRSDDDEMTRFLEYPDDVYAAASGGTTPVVELGRIDEEIDGFLRRSRRKRAILDKIPMAELFVVARQTSPGGVHVVQSEPDSSSEVLSIIDNRSSQGRQLSRREISVDRPTTSRDSVVTTVAQRSTPEAHSTASEMTFHVRQKYDRNGSESILADTDVEIANSQWNATRLSSTSPQQPTANSNYPNVRSHSTARYSLTDHNVTSTTSGDRSIIPGYTTCALTSDPGYIVYSACGSFWIPMLVMVFFYVRIYRTAIRATDALRRGVVTTKPGSSVGLAASADGSLSLRVHRGGGGGALSKTDSIAWTASSIRISNGSNSESTIGGGNLARNVSHGALFADFRCNRNSGSVERENETNRSRPTTKACLSTQSSCCDSISGTDAVVIRRPPLYRRMFVFESGEPTATASGASSFDAVDSDCCMSVDSIVDTRKCSDSMSLVTGKGANGRHSSGTTVPLVVDVDNETPNVPIDKTCDKTTLRVNGIDDASESSLQRCNAQQQLPKRRRRKPIFSRSLSDSLATKQRMTISEPETRSAIRPARLNCHLLTTTKAATTSCDDCSNAYLDDYDDDDSAASTTGGTSRYAGGSVGVEQLLRSTLTPVYEHCPAAAARVDSVSGQSSSSSSSRRGLLNIKNQLRRLNREKKAAKTVGIIVGGFVFCWTPFFAVYVLGAFCGDCTPAIVFSIFFWLGYCNSAINPFVYALCSNDFRDAFRRLLRCNGRIGGGRLMGSTASVSSSSRGGRRLARDRDHGVSALVRGIGPPHRQSRRSHADEYA